jgi:DNA-binding transcriptional ArsR family regulator
MNDPDLLFKAIADPSRRKLLDVLHEHDGRTLGELCEHLAMARQSVAQHLGLLEVAKLHFLDPVPLHDIDERWIRKFDEPRLAALHLLKQRLESDKA